MPARKVVLHHSGPAYEGDCSGTGRCPEKNIKFIIIIYGDEQHQHYVNAISDDRKNNKQHNIRLLSHGRPCHHNMYLHNGFSFQHFLVNPFIMNELVSVDESR